MQSPENTLLSIVLTSVVWLSVLITADRLQGFRVLRGLVKPRRRLVYEGRTRWAKHSASSIFVLGSWYGSFAVISMTLAPFSEFVPIWFPNTAIAMCFMLALSCILDATEKEKAVTTQGVET